MIRRLNKICAMLVLLCSCSLAGNGGSAYSRYGIGDIGHFPSYRATGTGGGGIAAISGTSVGAYNPAAWAHLSTTMFSAGVLYQGYSTKDDSSSEYLGSASFNHIALAIPVAAASGIVFGAGLSSFSEVNYDIVSVFPFNGIDSKLEYRGSGGLTAAHIGFSASARKSFHFGTKLNYYFGTIRHTVNQKFSSTDYTSSSVERTARLKGIGFTFGCIYGGLSDLFGLPEMRTLDFGAVFSPVSYLNSSNEKYLEYTTDRIAARDTAAEKDSKVLLPASAGFGLAYRTESFLLTGEVFYQNWARYDARGVNRSDYRDSWRYNAGAELLPRREVYSTFLQRISFQLGTYYNSTYYRIGGEPLNEIGVTGGAGLPVFRDGRIYIAAEYGIRGTTDMHRTKDNILRIFISLNSGERWFVKAEEE